MSMAVAAVLSQAKELSEAECEELYLRLGDHLYGPPGSSAQVSEEMKTMLDHRWEEIVFGKVRCVDPMAALQEVRAKYHV